MSALTETGHHHESGAKLAPDLIRGAGFRVQRFSLNLALFDGLKVQVPEHGKDSIRNEIFHKVAMANRRGERFDYTTHDKRKEAIEKKLFEERRDTIKLTIASRSPDTEQLRKLNDVIETLVTREGYCAECANEILKYVSSLLAREK